MSLRSLLPPTVMVKGICVGLILVVAMTMVATSFAHPLPVAAQMYNIGTYDDDEYDYDASTVTHDDNLRTVWIATNSQSFNYTHDAQYLGAAGKYQLDCSGHSYKFLEGVTYKSSGDVIAHSGNHMAHFITIQEHTPQFGLWRILCAQYPIM